MPTIAGHDFGLEGRCSCNMRFADISGAGPEHLGKPHWAHSGSLVAHELTEIQAEVQRLWSLVVGSATGNGPPAPARTEPSDDEITAMEAA